MSFNNAGSPGEFEARGDGVEVLSEEAGEALHQQRWQEAEDIARPNAEPAARALGAEHPITLTANHNLALVLFMSARPTMRGP
ncbi:hypothetical protein [Streptomyces chartreusis]|uniref:hypothetical protein n=1 Tax=Streptomyces chartreusis TaxID=1969 RepID=UPI003658EA07